MGVRLGPDGALLPDSVELVPSLVRPARRLTYVDVDEIYDECEEADERDLFDLKRVRLGSAVWACVGWGRRGRGGEVVQFTPVRGWVLACRAASPLPKPTHLPTNQTPAQLADLRRRYRVGCGATEILMPESSVSVEGAHLDVPRVAIEVEDQHSSPARRVRPRCSGRGARRARGFYSRACATRRRAGGAGGEGGRHQPGASSISLAAPLAPPLLLPSPSLPRRWWPK